MEGLEEVQGSGMFGNSGNSGAENELGVSWGVRVERELRKMEIGEDRLQAKAVSVELPLKDGRTRASLE